MAGMTKISVSANQMNAIFVVPYAETMIEKFGVQVLTDIVGTAQIGVIPPAQNGMRKVSNMNLDVFTPTLAIPLNKRDLTPVEVGMWSQFRADQLRGTNYFGLTKGGVKANDLSQDQILYAIYTEVASQAFYTDLFRGWWFGDMESSDVNFNFARGNFRRMIDDGFATVATPFNTSLASGEAKTILQAMYEAAPEKMSNLFTGEGFEKDFIYYVDRTMWDNFNFGLGTVYSDQSYTAIIDGQRVRAINGIEIRLMPSWGSSAFNSGMFGINSAANFHGAVLTHRENLAIGLSTNQTLDYEGWYDQNTMSYRSNFITGVDFNYCDKDLSVIAYPID